MTTTRRLATTAALLAALPLLLSACSDEEEPRPPIVSPTSPTPTPSPTQTATVPADESPEDFIRRWIEVDTSMQNTGDTKSYRAMTSDCEACDGLADQIESIYAAGGDVVTAGFTAKSTRVEKQTDSSRTLLVVVDAAPSTIRDKAGAQPRTLAGGSYEYRLELGRSQNRWLITSITQVVR